MCGAGVRERETTNERKIVLLMLVFREILRERERERERDRQTDRKRERERRTDRETERTIVLKNQRWSINMFVSR